MKREAFISLKAPFATRLPEAVRRAVGARRLDRLGLVVPSGKQMTIEFIIIFQV